MNLLEAWEKAKEGQKIFLCKEVITKGNYEGTQMREIKTIKKEIGEYPIHIGDTKEQTLIYVLRSHLLAMTLDQIFSNNWEIKKEKKTGWINIYKDSKGYYSGTIFQTISEAIEHGHPRLINTIKIEWEE